MKKMILVNNEKQIKDTINYGDAYLIGIENLCVNTMYYVGIDKLKEISQYLFNKNKELFVLINKNIHNKDLDYLKEVLISLNNLNIKGVFYSDISIVSLKSKLNLNYDLVWAAEHSTTNYNTINYWYNFGVKYTFISSDITYNDIVDIKKNTNSRLIIPIFGYLPMFVSYRHIVKNYLEHFKLSDSSNINYIKKENKTYPIVDNNIGTFVYSNNILNGIKYLEKFEENNIEYVLFNGFDIDCDKLVEVLKIYSGKSNNSINSLFENLDEGFLDTETIYKVKK